VSRNESDLFFAKAGFIKCVVGADCLKAVFEDADDC
jgi:hypothetical protein